MSKRVSWVIGLAVLVGIALLVACSGNYSASSDGLVIVPSLGSAVVQSFSFNLSSGSYSTIDSNPVIPGTPDQGAPTAVVLDPTQTYVYMTTSHVTTAPCTTSNAIASFKVHSDGSLSAIGSTPLPGPNPAVQASNPAVSLAIDNGNKFLFVANRGTCQQTGGPISAGYVTVFSIGSGASLTLVGTFVVPQAPGAPTPNPLALAVTHTGFPPAPATCAQNTAPSSEYLYVADEAGNDVIGYSVSSTGMLNPLTLVGYSTGTNPSGIAVDPCNRFVFVGNTESNNVTAFQICSQVGFGNCTTNDWSLVASNGSPFNAGAQPGPLVVDPYGFFLYALDTGSNQISAYKIAQSTGALTQLSPATYAAQQGAVSIAIRSDGSWLFVTNTIAGTISQFGVNPSTGTLIPTATPIITDNYPYGVAVK